jgi:hypothetical protein
VYHLCQIARGCGLVSVVALCGLIFGLSGMASSQPQSEAQTYNPIKLGYIPNGPNVPTIKLNEDQSGAYGQPQLREPPPSPVDQQSIWNMQVVGYLTDLGCSQSDQEWIEDQNGREIAYIGSGAGTDVNPTTHEVEQCGVAIYDVTNPSNPVFLSNLAGDPAGGNAPHTFVCSGDTLPNGVKGNYYLLTHRGNTSSNSGRDEIWNVTNPAAPTLLTTVVTGMNEYHKSFWECDTGIAYLIGDEASNSWQGKEWHALIYNLSNPKSPVFIRQFGLPGAQPSATPATAQNCMNAPSSPNCYEGVTNPPADMHQAYSAGTKINEVFFPYGVGSGGVIQIVARDKLLNGCSTSFNPGASGGCATNPTEEDLLYPQISYITMNPLEGAHNATPIFGVPIPEEQQNYLNGKPQTWNIDIVTSEAMGPLACLGEAPHDAYLMDITNIQTPWPISTLNVPQFPGDFCHRSARFGAHHTNWEIYAPYYGRLAFVSWFAGGLRVWDIRDPVNPRAVAYFIQKPTGREIPECGTNLSGETVCTATPYMDIVEVDDRGYIYGLDRAGAGVTILKLTGAAEDVVTGRNDSGWGGE